MASGNAGNKTTHSPDHKTEQGELAYALTHVPWIEFNVTARANVELLAKDPAIRGVVSRVAETTVKNITDTLIEDLTAKFRQTLIQAVKEATQAVDKQIMDNMNDIFRDLHISAKATPSTDYQILKDGNISLGEAGHNNGVSPAAPKASLPDSSVRKSSNTFPVTPISASNSTQPVDIMPDISSSQWIWTKEASIPVGARGFRTTISIKEGDVDSLIIDIACDGVQSLYVNGFSVGYSVDGGSVAKRWSITFKPVSTLVIAVYTSASRNTAGFIMDAIAFKAGTPPEKIHRIKTDASWKCLRSLPPKGFEQPDFDLDRKWEDARIMDAYKTLAIAKPARVERVTNGFKADQVRHLHGVGDAPQVILATAPEPVAGEGR